MVRINLLPVREILRKRELKQFAITGGAILVSAVLLMVVTYMIFSTKVSGLEAQKETQKKELAALQQKNQEINKLKAEIAGLERQRDTVKQLTQTRDTPAPFMAAVSVAIPDEVWLTNIDKTGKNFSLAGHSVDNTVVVKFVENLQKLRKNFTIPREGSQPGSKPEPPFFSSVKLVQTVRGGTGPGEIQFSITGTLN